MVDFWPTAGADPANADPMAEFARIWQDMRKVVFSRTLERAGGNTTVLHDVDPGQIRALQAEPGGDMALGCADLAATFLRLGLIDEICLYLHPIVLGTGKRMFGPQDARVALTLAETRTFGNGVVLLRYATVPS